jgi:hypothetical protein
MKVFHKQPFFVLAMYSQKAPQKKIKKSRKNFAEK